MVGGGLAQVGGKAVLASTMQLSPPLAPSRLLVSEQCKHFLSWALLKIKILIII